MCNRLYIRSLDLLERNVVATPPIEARILAPHPARRLQQIVFRVGARHSQQAGATPIVGSAMSKKSPVRTGATGMAISIVRQINSAVRIKV